MGPPCPLLRPIRSCRPAGSFYFACAVCFIFMIGEVVGGSLAHSLAIMTDAAHLLTDLGSMCVSIFSLWVSTRPPTKNMNFGWHRSDETIESELVVREATELLQSKFELSHCTIQVERYLEEMEECQQCRDPLG